MKDKSHGRRLQHIRGRDSKYSSGTDKEAIQRKCKFIKVLKLPPLCSFGLIFPGLTALSDSSPLRNTTGKPGAEKQFCGRDRKVL